MPDKTLGSEPISDDFKLIGKKIIYLQQNTQHIINSQAIKKYFRTKR